MRGERSLNYFHAYKFPYTKLLPELKTEIIHDSLYFLQYLSIYPICSHIFMPFPTRSSSSSFLITDIGPTVTTNIR